jgi:hypothetical protein
MRFIPTTPERVEQLKKDAKRLQRNGGGKHSDLLNRVAKSAGYQHWHHVTRCLREAQRRRNPPLLAECQKVIEAEAAGEVLIISTGPECTADGPLLLFSSGIGDAWLLDPRTGMAACLVWRGEPQDVDVEETEHRLLVGFHGEFEIEDALFMVRTQHTDIRTRSILGYPVEAIKNAMLAARSITQMDREKVFGAQDQSKYLWCLHCERSYLRGRHRQVGSLQMCPYDGCDGDAVIDAWSWPSVRENNPGYPETPQDGVVYPLYGPDYVQPDTGHRKCGQCGRTVKLRKDGKLPRHTQPRQGGETCSASGTEPRSDQASGR